MSGEHGHVRVLSIRLPEVVPCPMPVLYLPRVYTISNRRVKSLDDVPDERLGFILDSLSRAHTSEPCSL